MSLGLGLEVSKAQARPRVQVYVRVCLSLPPLLCTPQPLPAGVDVELSALCLYTHCYAFQGTVKETLNCKPAPITCSPS